MRMMVEFRMENQCLSNIQITAEICQRGRCSHERCAMLSAWCVCDDRLAKGANHREQQNEKDTSELCS